MSVFVLQYKGRWVDPLIAVVSLVSVLDLQYKGRWTDPLLAVVSQW